MLNIYELAAVVPCLRRVGAARGWGGGDCVAVAGWQQHHAEQMQVKRRRVNEALQEPLCQKFC